MASNRDPRKDYRINRRGRKVTSSADRSKRAKKASAPKPTSSSTRSRGKGTGSKRVTSSGGRLNRAKQAMIGRMLDKSTKGKRSQKPITGNTPKPQTKVKKTGLKLKGTWASERKLDKKFLKDMKANNLESSLFNDERLKGSTDAKQERAQRLRTRNKVVKGPGSKAVRKKPVTGPSRGASGPRNPPVQGPSRKTPNIVADIPNRSNKPKTSGPPGLGKVKFDPKNRVTPKSGGGIGQIRGMGTAALAGALASGSLRNPVSKAKKREASKSIGKYNTRDKDGTVRSRIKVGPKKVGPGKVGPGKVGTEAQNFDKAFAAARKAGKSTFTWKGKKYNTKRK